MTDQELNEQYWLIGVDEALTTAQALLKAKIYNQALFYCQLAVEKQLKAYIVKNLDRSAPIIHDCVELAEIAKLLVNPTQKDELRTITTFNLAARYDSGTYEFKIKANRKYAFTWYKITREILKWLKTQ